MVLLHKMPAPARVKAGRPGCESSLKANLFSLSIFFFDMIFAVGGFGDIDLWNFQFGY